jgi:succinyl-CoA synthetase alpha subunit
MFIGRPKGGTMNSNILIAKNVIVQGITGSHGSFHTAAMIAAGTNIVAGTSPNKAGQTVNGVPVYATIADIQKVHSIDTSIIFVPAPFAKDAMFEAINAGVPLIICITEGVPVHDMLAVKKQADATGATIIGPNCPGVLIPGINKLGIIPANMGTPGTVGIVSRSGTLTYEAAAGLTARGIGQKYVIGIGGDRIQGTNFVDCLELFENDPDVSSIVLIGEIGGTTELKAADYILSHISKPVFAYIAGHTAPKGISLGHAGAILGSGNESADAKTKALKQVGVITSGSIVELIKSVKQYPSLTHQD